MAIDINLANLANLQNETSAVNLINANMASITTAFEDVVSESGQVPNQMLSSLDMNSHPVINLPSPSTALEPVRLTDLQAAQLSISSLANPLSVTNITDSTSPSTGSINTLGGLGVTKSLNVGGNATVTGNLTVTGTVAGNTSSTAASLRGNSTNATANTSNITIQNLTARGAPDANNDKLLIYDNAAGTLKSVTPGQIATAATAGVTALNGQTGAVTLVQPPGGRLTLTTGVPVMSTSVSASATVFYTPYFGRTVPIYDGTNMIPTQVAEVSQATTDATKSPAATTSNANYDMFVWNDAGTVRCTRGPAWTNDTTRSAGTALVLTNGIYLNNATITNGPAASRGTYVGTIRTNGTSTVNYIFGAAGAGGVAADFGVWNAYNRVEVTTMVTASTASWTYAVSDTWRASANGSATFRVNAVRGLDEDGIVATYYAAAQATSTGTAIAGVGLDTTTSYSGITAGTVNTAITQLIATYQGVMGLGYHFISGNEYNDTTNASTWRGLVASPTPIQTGLTARLLQ